MSRPKKKKQTEIHAIQLSLERVMSFPRAMKRIIRKGFELSLNNEKSSQKKH
jgi:hypothetical protein